MTETAGPPAATGRGRKAGRPERRGLSVERVHTTPGVHPYDEVTWQRRDVVMTNWRDGTVNFEQRGVEFPDSWSVNEVLAHLRACADVWGGSMARILKQDNPTFRYVSPRAWIRKTNYTSLEFRASFLAFRDQRKDLLKLLRHLPPTDWLRCANVKSGTKLQKETVLSYAQRLARHEAGHCEQIDRILTASQLV